MSSRDLLHQRHQRRGGIDARVGGVEAGDVAQDDEQVGVDQRRDQGRQVVVVAEVELHLLDRDGVVLVDDRQHAGLQQLLEGVARVDVAAAVGEIVVGEQDLRHRLAVGAEALVVERHEADLADRGRGLAGGHGLGPLAQAEAGRCRRRRRRS